MNPQFVETNVRLAIHEREAIRQRLAQIKIALGHPRLTARQAAALGRERKQLEQTLAPVDADETISL